MSSFKRSSNYESSNLVIKIQKRKEPFITGAQHFVYFNKMLRGDEGENEKKVGEALIVYISSEFITRSSTFLPTPAFTVLISPSNISTNIILI